MVKLNGPGDCELGNLKAGGESQGVLNKEQLQSLVTSEQPHCF